MENLRTFEIKFFGPTNNRGARVKITDCKRNESIFIEFDYSYTNSWEVARDYLEQELGIEINFRSWSDTLDWLHSEDFKHSLKGGELK